MHRVSVSTPNPASTKLIQPLRVMPHPSQNYSSYTNFLTKSCLSGPHPFSVIGYAEKCGAA